MGKDAFGMGVGAVVFIAFLMGISFDAGNIAKCRDVFSVLKVTGQMPAWAILKDAGVCN